MKKATSDKFGINMRQFCKEHERWLEQQIEQYGSSQELLSLHLEKLRWLQHERLIHLLVLIMTLFTELFFVFLALTYPEIKLASAAVMLILIVLLLFYFIHYFFLENTTQHWYRIAEKIMEKIEQNDKNPLLHRVEEKPL